MTSKQRGFTLISLMVGLVVSMIVMLGAMALYKGMIRSLFLPGGVRPNARQDGQLATALVTVQMALQSAGYGIPSAVSGTHFVLLQNASLDAGTHHLAGTTSPITANPTSGNLVAWESNEALASDTSTFKCSALWSNQVDRSLYLLKSNGACHPISATLTTVVWTQYLLVSPNVLPGQGVGLAAQSNVSCWPFGAVPQTISGFTPQFGGLQVAITYSNSSTGSASTGVSNSDLVCLSNFSS